MKCPSYLDEVAKKFWTYHHDKLQELGRLNPENYYPFISLCKLWSIVQQTSPLEGGRTAITFFAAQKSFAQLAKEFGLTPKQSKKMDTDFESGELPLD